MYKTILFISCLFLICSAMHVNLNHEAAAQFKEGRITIKAGNGAYFGRCSKCGPAIVQDMVSIHETDPTKSSVIWTVEQVGDYFGFKSDKGQYLSRCYQCWKKSTKIQAVGLK